jgi:putative membrane-bound dehydrogenase-like protein
MRRLAVLEAIVLSSTLVAISGGVAAQTTVVVPHGQDRAPNAPRPAVEAIKAMTVPPGFTVELVAGEPDIVNPVAMTFDERGRIWITESLEYPRRQAGPGRDRVKVLEDTDGDGKADKFTVFADGLNIPSGIAVGHGGVWVANAPDILFLHDRDRDGKADTQDVVVTGFGRQDTHELPNSLTWGPDGWLYGWNGVFNPAKVVSKNGTTYQFTCAIFRIHPKTRVFEIWCQGTSNPWGIAINPEGSFFASACVIDHLWHLVETGYYIRQGGPYPPYTWPIESIVDHKHQKAAYCGIHYFDSPAYPPAYRNRLYMGNIHGNCINVDILEKDGSTYRARAAPDFLQANDAWFMPVVQKTGPDGCLYILDWYDQYHCYQDANRDPAGIDRNKGRLYRVRYKDNPRRTGFDLARQSADELIKLLGSPNVYDRDIAQRLLTERASPAISSKLEPLVLDGKAPFTQRMHGLWALIGGGPLEPSFHVKLLSLSEPAFVAWGVRAAGNMGKVEPAVLDDVLERGSDSSVEARLQLAIAARKLQGIDPLPLVLDVLIGSEDPLIPHIVWQNLSPLLATRPLEFALWVKRDLRTPSPGLKLLAPRVIEQVLDSPKADADVIRVLLDKTIAAENARKVLDRLSDRIRQRELPPAIVEVVRQNAMKVLKGADPGVAGPLVLEYRVFLAYCGDPESLKETWKTARSPIKGDGFENRDDWEELRIRAVNAVLYRNIQGSVHLLLGSILAENDRASSIAFRGEVLDSLSSLDDPELAPIVLKAFPTMASELKPRAIEFLTERPSWSKALLAAIDDKRIPASVLNVNQLRRLQTSKDPEIARQVKSHWGTIREGRNPERERVVRQLRNLVRSTPGDPVAGQAVFNKLCAQCHKIHGEGQEVGPDITLNGRNDFEQLLSNVFDPSLVIGPGNQATTVATIDGRVLTGLLAEDGKDRVILKLEGGKLETIPRDQIDEMKLSNVSLMPEEIEKQLAPREITDLFAFLCLDKPPSDPTSKPLPGAGPILRKEK